MPTKITPEYVPVFKPGTNRLFFKYCPNRGLVEIQDRGVKYIIDLAQYQAPESAESGNSDTLRTKSPN
jgi:hypothetical protein